MREKELRWVGRSKEELGALPREVQRAFGYALWLAQIGEKHPRAIPLKGFGGAGVLEVVEDDAAGTYWGMYTVRFAEVVYALLFFQKKSHRGVRTDKRLIDLLRQRLREAETDHDQREKRTMTVTVSGGNVFADLGFPNPDEEMAKARLALAITKAIRAKGLTQEQAAQLLGTTQSQISNIGRGKFGNITYDKLFDYLNRLGYTVEINIAPGEAGHVELIAAPS